MSGTVSWEQLVGILSFLTGVASFAWWLSGRMNGLHVDIVKLTEKINTLETEQKSLGARITANAASRRELYSKVEELVLKQVAAEAAEAALATREG